MKLRSEPPVGVMEGKGFYNEYAAIPASGEEALPASIFGGYSGRA